MDLALDLNGDLELQNADLYTLSDIDAVKQFLQQQFRMFLGEWFLDQTKGISWFDDILVKNPRAVVIDTIFKNMILSTPGVVELASYDLQLNGVTRELTLNFTARVDGGTIDFSETFSIGG
jgi:hypothetical protein